MDAIEGEAVPKRRRGLHYRLYDWVLHWAAHRRSQWALFGLSFAEASFFPVPPDVLLIAMAMARPARARRYAAIATAGSVIGGVAGFGIGWSFWHLVGPYFFRFLGPFGFNPENFRKVQSLYQDNAFLAVFSAGLTPIPYKVFTIAAGVFEIGFGVFVVASVLGRGGRFFLVGELTGRLGPKVQPFIERYLGWLTLAFVALLVLGFWVLGKAG